MSRYPQRTPYAWSSEMAARLAEADALDAGNYVLADQIGAKRRADEDDWEESPGQADWEADNRAFIAQLRQGEKAAKRARKEEARAAPPKREPMISYGDMAKAEAAAKVAAAAAATSLQSVKPLSMTDAVIRKKMQKKMSEAVKDVIIADMRKKAEASEDYEGRKGLHGRYGTKPGTKYTPKYHSYK